MPFDRPAEKEEYDRQFIQSIDMIYSLGLRLFYQDRDAASDFVQDVYLHALKNYPSFQFNAKFSTWLYTVGLNLGLNKIKKNKQFSRNVELLPDEDVQSSEVPAWQQLEEESLRRDILLELNQLPRIYGLCLILYYYEKMPYQEIADKLEINLNTVKSHIRRAKKILETRLTETYSLIYRGETK